MKKTKIKHRLSTVIRVLFSVLLIILVLGVGNTVLGDNLATATGEGSTTTTTTDVYIPVASATVNVGTNVTEVMVVATFEVMALIKQGHLGRFRLKNNTNTAYSQVIERYLERATDGDKGIGSIVYIFDVPSGSGNTEFILEHATSSGSYNNTTSGTIVAIAMGTTTSGIPLGNDVKSITTAVSPTTTDTWEVVTGLTTDAVSLPADGEIFIATSINSDLSGGTNQTGEWKLQQKKGSGAWEDIGLSVTRSLSSPGDVGIASLGMMVTGLTRDDYYFQLLHKGTGTTVQTLNTSLIAVALTYLDNNNIGHAFPAFKTSLSSKTTTSPTLEPALSQQGTPISNTDMFFYAQYKMSATAAFDSPTFDMYLVDDNHASFNYSSMDQQRRLNSDDDSGSGASVGLAEDLKKDSTYTASLRHASNGTITLTTSSMILSGFQTTDYICGGYWIGGDSGNETQWNIPANWADGLIPTSSTNVTIYDKANDPVISASADCKNLAVESGATLSIQETKDLTVAEDLTNSGTITVESSSSGTGSLIIEGTATGDIAVERYLTADKWHYIAGQTNISGNFGTLSMGLTGGVSGDQFYRWEESLDWGGNFGNWVDILNGPDGNNPTMDSEGFVSCKGYGINYITTNKTLSLSGVPYTTTQTISITKTTESTSEGANLIGNPFTSTISLNTNAGADNFIGDNSGVLDDIYGGVYLWNEQANYESDRNDYYTVSLAVGTEFAAPGQGFMIVTDIASGAVATFDENIRKHGTATFYKNTAQDETPRFYMSVQNDEGLYNEILIAFIDGMTKGLDPSYDAGKLKGNPNIALYTTLVEDNGADFAHQALPPLDNVVVEVKTGLDVSGAGSYTFKIKELQNFNETISIKLEDKLMGSLINFRQAEEYSFFINTPGEIRERFVLHFNGVTGIEDDGHIKKATIQTYGFNNTLYILNPEMKQGIITIYNLTGQKAATFKLTGDTKQQQTLNINDVINVVQINTDNEVISKKVIFK